MGQIKRVQIRIRDLSAETRAVVAKYDLDENRDGTLDLAHDLRRRTPDDGDVYSLVSQMRNALVNSYGPYAVPKPPMIARRLTAAVNREEVRDADDGSPRRPQAWVDQAAQVMKLGQDDLRAADAQERVQLITALAKERNFGPDIGRQVARILSTTPAHVRPEFLHLLADRSLAEDDKVGAYVEGFRGYCRLSQEIAAKEEEEIIARAHRALSQVQSLASEEYSFHFTDFDGDMVSPIAFFKRDQPGILLMKSVRRAVGPDGETTEQETELSVRGIYSLEAFVGWWDTFGAQATAQVPGVFQGSESLL